MQLADGFSRERRSNFPARLEAAHAKRSGHSIRTYEQFLSLSLDASLNEDHKRLIRCIRQIQLLVARKHFQVRHRNSHLCYRDCRRCLSFSKLASPTMYAMYLSSTRTDIST